MLVILNKSKSGQRGVVTEEDAAIRAVCSTNTLLFCSVSLRRIVNNNKHALMTMLQRLQCARLWINFKTNSRASQIVVGL